MAEVLALYSSYGVHFRMTIEGLPYSHQGQMTFDEIIDGSPCGATTTSGGMGPRNPRGTLQSCDPLECTPRRLKCFLERRS
jgi:hypothetical protein